jgi:serine/threonine-protein kinase ATR
MPRTDIRTYGVVTLNEECGFIQWVPNTIPIRPVLLKGYEAKGIRSWVRGCAALMRAKHTQARISQIPELNDLYRRSKEASDKEAAEAFVSKVLPMSAVYSYSLDVVSLTSRRRYPPVFHDWFVETFPEPSAWLASRLAYGRTAAVMSMVGFILG